MLVFLLGISSCGLKLGEKAKNDSAVEITSVSCLDSSMATIQSLFKAQAQDSEIVPALQCLSSTIQTFSTSIHGADKNYFTTQELIYFLNKNIITKGSKISDALANEIMKIKVSALGGNNDQFTKSELKQLSRIIDEMAPEVVKLNRHMPIIVQQWDYSKLTRLEKEHQFHEAHLAFTTFTDQFFAYFSKSKTAYDVNSGIDLIKEFMIHGNLSPESLKTVEVYRTIAVAVKENLIGDHSPEIKNTDWAVASKALSSTLFLIQRYNYFAKVDGIDYEFAKNNKLSRYGLLGEDIAADVYEILTMQEDRVVSYAQLIETFNVVFRAYDMHITLTTAMMKDITFLKDALIDHPHLGETQAWDKDNFLLLQDKLQGLLRESGMVLSTINQMNTDPSWKTDYVLFEKMEQDFLDSVTRLSEVFQGQYDLKYIKPLLISLLDADLMKSDEFIKDYDKYYNSITSAKKLITGEPGSTLESHNIKYLFLLAGRAYFHVLEYKNYIKPIEYKDEKFADRILNILPKLKLTLNDALDAHLKGYFLTEDFIETYSSLANDLEAKRPLTGRSLDVILKTLWSNILIDPEHRIAGQTLPGFNLEALNNLNSLIKLLFEGHKLGAEIFKTNSHPTQAQLTRSIQELYWSSSDAYQIQILKEMYAAFSGPVPLTTKDGFLKILDPYSDQYSYEDIQLSNTARLVARVLENSYATNLSTIAQVDRLESQLSLDELQFAFDQIKSVLYEREILNPDGVDFLAKRFQDANLFVSRSNGDDFASFLEIHDVTIHLVTGTIRAQKARENIYTHCLTPDDLPLNRKTEIYDSCLLDNYFLFNQGFESLPSYVLQKTILGESKFKDYSYNLLIAAGHTPNDQQFVLLDDADNFPHIVQYIEMMYAKFDKDLNGELTKDEALAAFPTFEKLIKKVVTSMNGGSKIKESQYPGVFIYFLKNGRGPKNFIEKLQFMNFISNEKKWIVNATRFDIGIVFKFIQESGHKPTSVPGNP